MQTKLSTKLTRHRSSFQILRLECKTDEMCQLNITLIVCMKLPLPTFLPILVNFAALDTIGVNDAITVHVT